jgi:DNA polymerase-1
LRRRFETGSSLKQVWYDVRNQPGVFVFDGAYAKDRRKKLYPEYKARRTPASDFLYKQFDLFREMCQFLPIACIRVKGWEADDVIATLVRSEPNEQFIIESTDVDFMQLPNVRIAREKPAPVEPQYMRLYKTLVGDPSDNIGGLKGFGKGAWDKLSASAKDFLIESFEHPEGPWELLGTEVNSRLLDRIVDSQEQLRLFWHIVGLWDVPMDELLAGTKIGVDDVPSAEKVFKEYML